MTLKLAVIWGITVKVGQSMRIHLINLDRSTERLAKFQRRNAHLHDVVRFSAVDGRLLDREKLIKEGVIAGDCGYTPGNLGSAMSHISLWRLAVDEQQAVTIAEDDGIFSGNFEARSKECLASLAADWDIVLWGFNFNAFVWIDLLPRVSTATMQFFQDQLQRNIDNFKDLEIKPTLLRLRHLFGIPCYSVTPKGARALLDLCLPLNSALIDFPGFDVRIENNGLDFAMNVAYPSLNAFVCIPPLVVAENRGEASLK